MNKFVKSRAFLLGAAAMMATATPASAATVGAGTVWYDDASLTGQTNSGTSIGFWAPSGQASGTGFSFTFGSNTTTNDNSTIASTVYLQNLVMVNATTGTGTAGYLTVVDTSTNTVVGASTNSVTLTPGATQSAGTPWRFDNLALTAGTRYAFVFTTTAGAAGVTTTTIPVDGGVIAGATDIDSSVAGSLTTVSYRYGGLTSNQASNVIAGTGAFVPAAGSYANCEVWFSAGLTTTSQSLQALSGGITDATQASAITMTAGLSGLRKTGTATYTLSSAYANAISGDIFVEEGVLKLATASNGTTSGIIGSGQVFLLNGNPTATAVNQSSVTMSGTGFEVNVGANNATLDNAIEGAGKLTKSAGAGTLTITSTNSFSGNLVINGGSVSVSTVSDIGQTSNIGRGNSSADSIGLIGGSLVYTGTGGSTNRKVGVAPAGGTILNNGSGALSFTSTASIGFNGTVGTRAFTLGGSYAASANVFAGIIADNTGATSLTKSGAGIWALTGANSYTGTTTISAGTLQVGNAGGTGALGTGAVTISSGTSLKFNRTGTLAVSANIGGAGAISNEGTGEISLTGTNTFSGDLTINAGTFAFEGVNSGGSLASVTIAANGRLAVGSGFAGGTLTLKNVSGSGLINNLFNATTGTRTLAFDSAADTTFSGTINDDTAATNRILAIEKKGSAILTLSGTGNFTGGTKLSAGTLNVTGNTALGTGALTIAGGTLTGTATLANSVVLNANLAATVATSNTLAIGAVSESGGSFGLTKSGNGTLSLSGASSYTGVTTVSTGRLKLATGATLASPSIVLTDGATLETVDGLSLGANKSLSLGAGSAIASATHVGNFTLAGGTLNIDFGASTNDTLAITGNLTLTSGTISFAKATTYSSGTFALASYTGSFAGATSNVSTAGLSADGTSRQTFTLVNDAVAQQLQLVVGGQAQNVRWTGTANALVDGSWSAGGSSSANWLVTDAGYAGTQGNQFFNGDAVTFDDSGATGSVALGAALSPVTTAFTGDTLAYSLTSAGGSIAAGSLAKSGNATLTIGMTNAYAGGTTLSAGRLRVGADGALGSGLVVISGGRLSSDSSAARTLSNSLRFTADVSIGHAIDNGVLNLSGGIDLNAAAPRTLTLDSDVVVTGAISNGSLTKAGNGKLTLSGANSLGVGLTIGAGTVALGGSGVIADAAAVSVSSGATLDLAGYTEALGSLSLASGSTVTAGNISGGTVTITDNVTFGATLTAASQLVKNGSFALTLGSASARTGATTLNAGSILVGDATALGGGAVTLNGGTLAMSDTTDRALANNLTIGGDVTLGAANTGKLTLGGTVGLGGQARALTTANDVRLNGIVSNGSLTKAGNGVLTLAASNTYSLGTTIAAGSVIATNANALGTGTVTMNTAATGSANTSLGIDATGGSVTFARGITVANQGTGTTTIGSSVFNNTAQQAIFSGVITLAKDVTLAGASGGDRTQFSGGITGTGNVTIGGTGRVLFLTTANSFTGSLTLSDNAILQLSDGTSTASSLIPDAALVTLGSGSSLRIGKGGNATAETIGGLAGSGTVTSVSGADKLIVDQATDTVFSGSLSQTAGSLALTKSGAGKLTLSGSYALTGALTVNAGTLSFTSTASPLTLSGITLVKGTLQLATDTNLGTNLENTTSDTAANVSFGANTLTIGTQASGNGYFGKLTGTGTIRLRGGSASVSNYLTGANETSTNRWVWVPVTSAVQAKAQQFFGLDTGASLTDRRDFIFANDTGDALVLSSLTGYGAIRGDWTVAGSAVTNPARQIVVEQSTDTVFNGAILSHRSTGGAQRSITLTKRGNGTLELAGFVGKQTASAGNGTGGGVALTVEAGTLSVTNAYNTTTTNTQALDLGLVTVTGGTLAFSAQALVNTAGTVGATRIDMNGGKLLWNTGNTQDITAGGRLKVLDGKVAALDTNGNDVTLGTAFALGTLKTGGLTKSGSGTLTLNAANALKGAVTVTGGTLLVGNASALGSGDVSVSGGTLDLGGLALDNAGITYNSGTLSGASAYAGSLTVAGGTLAFAQATSFGTAAITVGSGATLDFNDLNPTNAITLNGGDIAKHGSWNGAVSVTAAVDTALLARLAPNEVTVKAGATVDLAGSSKSIIYQGGTLDNLGSYSGTLVARGTLDFSAVAPGASAIVRVDNGGLVNIGAFGGAVQYAGGALTNYSGQVSVYGTGVTLAAGSLDSATAVVGAGASASIGSGFSSAIRIDGGEIVGDTLNNFSGTVTVAAGKTFDIDGADSTAVINSGAAVVLESGATLKGSGTVGQVTVAGGILSPGNSPGLLTTSGLALTAGSMKLEIASVKPGDGTAAVAGTDYDSVNVAGTLDLTQLSPTSRFVLDLVSYLQDGTTPGAPGSWDPATDFSLAIFSYGFIDPGANTDINKLFTVNTTGFLDASGFQVDSWHFKVVDNVGTQQVLLTYSSIPEPSTYGAMLGGLALAAAAIRRRRKQASK